MKITANLPKPVEVTYDITGLTQEQARRLAGILGELTGPDEYSCDDLFVQLIDVLNANDVQPIAPPSIVWHSVDRRPVK